jgi:hypothetical protein
MKSRRTTSEHHDFELNTLEPILIRIEYGLYC